MTREEYRESLMEAFRKGRISEDAFWAGLANEDEFCYDD